jgi:hypothetical protein
MKEMSFSFQVKIALKRRDFHWIEDELLMLREGMFLEVMKRILRAIRALVGKVKVLRVRLHCQGCGQDSYPLDEAIGLEGGERRERGDDNWGEGEGLVGGCRGQL